MQTSVLIDCESDTKMMNKDVSQPSTLEILPNEILLDIFEHFNIQNAYNAFSGLNHRFDLLLESDQLSTSRLLIWSTDTEYDRDQRFVRLFANRIRKLAILNHCRGDGDRLRLVDLVSFDNVRTLTIENPTAAQCQNVHPRFFPYLEHLTISNKISLFDYDKRSISLNPKLFPHLHTFHIDHKIWSIEWSIDQTPAKLLRSVTVRTDHARLQYSQILSTCPNLIDLKLILDEDDHVSDHDHQVPATTSSLHFNLRRLVLDVHKCLSLPLLDHLLSLVPNLTHLTIVNGPFTNRVDRLAAVLHRNIVHLQYLQIIRMTLSSRMYIWMGISDLHPLFILIKWNIPRSRRQHAQLTIMSNEDSQQANAQ